MAKYPHMHRGTVFYILMVLVLFGLVLYFSPSEETSLEDASTSLDIVLPAEMPDFESIVDVDAKKDAFFGFLEPYIDLANQRILQQRIRLERLHDKIIRRRPLTVEERNFIANLSARYEVESETPITVNHITRLLKRVDIIPKSLALVQAANESAWGTSRFAMEGKNFFGQWCYTEGCGIVPNRAEDANHEVKSFDSVEDSVEAYFMNLNTFHTYQKLRDIRQALRDQNLPVDGISLTEGLDSYSERGEEYIQELQSMIQTNELHREEVLTLP